MKQVFNIDPCRACPMAGLCDPDECGMKLYPLDTPKATRHERLERFKKMQSLRNRTANQVLFKM